MIYTDGGARGNPGPSGIGVVIQDEKGEVLHELSTYLGAQTNNFAEYEALIEALKLVVREYGDRLPALSLEVRMDSELVVRQLNGIYKVKEPTLKIQFARVASLRAKLPRIIFTHIRREQNKRADLLANEAMDRGK